MRSTTRYSALIGLLLVLAFSLTGCMHLDRSVALNGDGSGSYTLTIGFSEQLVSLASDQISTSMNDFGDKVKKEGGSFRHYDDTGYSYWAYTRPFKTVAELNKLVQETPQTGDPASTGSLGGLQPNNPDTLNVTQQSGFLQNTFHVTGHISLKLPNPPDASTGGIDVSTYLKDLRESVSITMPGSITSHKGGTVTGNTVAYTIHYGEDADIDVVGGGLDSGAVLPVGAGAVVVLAAFGGLFFALSRRGKRGASVGAEEAVPVVAGGAGSDTPTLPSVGERPEQPDSSL